MIKLRALNSNIEIHKFHLQFLQTLFHQPLNSNIEIHKSNNISRYEEIIFL